MRPGHPELLTIDSLQDNLVEHNLEPLQPALSSISQAAGTIMRDVGSFHRQF